MIHAITVACDHCYSMEEFRPTATAKGFDERHLDDLLEESDWIIQDGNHFCCEDCMHEYSQDNGQDFLQKNLVVVGT